MSDDQDTIIEALASHVNLIVRAGGLPTRHQLECIAAIARGEVPPAAPRDTRDGATCPQCGAVPLYMIEYGYSRTWRIDGSIGRGGEVPAYDVGFNDEDEPSSVGFMCASWHEWPMPEWAQPCYNGETYETDDEREAGDDSDD